MSALNLLTMLSGSIGKENLSRLFQGEDKASGDSAETLMAQIGLLAQPESQENLTLPITDFAEISEQLTQLTSFDSEQMSSTMQEIAGLLGNKLPSSEHFDQEIDLEKTMQKLSEVLAHIEAATESLTNSTGMSGNVERAVTDEAKLLDHSAEETPAAIPLTTMPLNIIENPDKTILAVDANTKLPLEDQNDTGITDGEGNIPKLIKNILQNGEELSNGKSLIEEQRIAGESKVSADGKAVDPHAKTDSKTASIEKKLAPSTAVEKPVPKMALDMAQLHRQIAGQTKIEAPAMSKPMAHPEWGQELGERIVWMNNRAMPFAELKLNPQHLGPISIRIDMNQDQATIAFSAQQAAVKEAIEAAIPKLREMMGVQQLNVAEISVTQASLNEQTKLPGFGQTAQHQNEGGQKNSRGTRPFENSGSAANASEDVDNANAVTSSGILSIFA
jgi:flagellar hook-length control protein FliK